MMHKQTRGKISTHNGPNLGKVCIGHSPPYSIFLVNGKSYIKMTKNLGENFDFDKLC
jgi:hypothetical protein